jgi:hypothetical protein
MAKFGEVVLDTDATIRLFEVDAFSSVLSQCRVTMTQHVAEVEVRHYPGDEFDELIDLSPYVKANKLTIVPVTKEEEEVLLEKFSLLYQGEIHSGEKSSLAYLARLVAQDKPAKICSGDHGVFLALGALGWGDFGISLQELLDSFSIKRKVGKYQFTKQYRQTETAKGVAAALQGRALRK